MWGPKPFGLGFIGAPIATAISFNLISICSIVYGLFFVPRTAWAPLSHKAFTNIPVILRLGLAGVCQIGSEWWSWELVACTRFMSSAHLLMLIFTCSGRKFVGPSGLGHSVRPPRFCVNHFPGTVCFKYRRFRPHRKCFGRIQGQACGRCQSRVIFHCLLYRNGVEVRVLFSPELAALCLIPANSIMFMVSRDHWAKLFNNDPGMVHLHTSHLRDVDTRTRGHRSCLFYPPVSLPVPTCGRTVRRCGWYSTRSGPTSDWCGPQSCVRSTRDPDSS